MWISTARFRYSRSAVTRLRVDGAVAEVDLWVGRQHRLEDGDDWSADRTRERDSDARALPPVADALLQRVKLRAAERIACRLQLIRHKDRKHEPGEHPDNHAGHTVEDNRFDLDLAVRELRGAVDHDEDRENDPEETVDARIRCRHVRRLLQDAARL